MKPPIGLANQYARYLRARYDRIWTEADLLRGWDDNPALPHRGVRADASDHVHSILDRLIKVQADNPVPSGHLEAFAGQVSKFNKRVVGVPVSSLGSPADSFRDTNLQLIRKLDAEQVAQLREILEDAERNATRVETLRAQIQERLEVTKSHADLIARDQTMKLNGDLTKYRQQGAGITQYEWSTSNDERVRPGHADLDGTIQSWDLPPVTNDKTGDRNHPGQDIQCRCVAVPYLG